MPSIFDAVPNVHPHDMQMAVALGTIPGWRIWRKWNENAEVSGTQEEFSNIASGVRTLPTTATVITFASSSVEDDPVKADTNPGTGAWTVRVWYLDENWDEQTEDVTLNGTANVTTTGTAIRLMDCDVLTTGSSGAAAGNITITIDSNPQARILIGHNQTRESAIHVPNNHTFIPAQFIVGTGRVGGSVDTDIAVEVRNSAGTTPWITVVSFEVYQTIVSLPFISSVLTEKSDYRVLGTASGGTGPDCHVQTEGFLIRNDHLPALSESF